MTRGTLRIYLGPAPGVGKTYAMLTEGRRRRDLGADVVVGLVETHGRAGTAEQIGDLEVVPRRAVLHRGTTLEEMDIDAVLARRPDVALVDELAHTNAPGSRNVKRWQDVEELLEAGIEVISTVNVQHLESVNDVLARITGVRQQETIPDTVVRQADQIELIDMSPEALRRRLAAGDVYPSERIDAALGNYFRPGNLGALREIALLWTADRVDDALRSYRELHGIEEPWETRERVVVAMTGEPGDEPLIRRAARMAVRSHGELIGVHVVPQDGLATTAASELERLRALVEQLGGVYRERAGQDVAETLVEAARAVNATRIVLGSSRRSRLDELMRGSVINRVIRLAGGDLDVDVIAREELTPRGGGRRRRPPALPPRRRRLAAAVAVAGLPLLTLLLSQTRSVLELPTALLLNLLLVVAVAAIGGAVVALPTALASFLAVNWFLTPPLYSFTIGNEDDVIALLVFLAVAGVVSTLVELAARRAAEGARARADAAALARLAGSSPPSTLLDGLVRTFALDGAAVLHRDPDGGWSVDEAAGPSPPATPEDASAQLELDGGHVLATAGPPPNVDDAQVLEAFRTELSASIAIQELEQEAGRIERLERADELRAALLAAVSHDLRTPLTGIKAAVTSLLQTDIAWSDGDQREFLGTIDAEADRLDHLLGNLLDMSRIQAGALQVLRRPVGLEEVVPAALASLGDRADGVEVEVAETLPRVDADPGLLERALANVVANAVDWSPPGTPVRLVAGAVGDDRVDVRVCDRGPGIAPGDREAVFMPFQRRGDARAGVEGLGLGLAVARGFLEAMDGEVEIDETPGGGATVVLRLRRAA